MDTATEPEARQLAGLGKRAAAFFIDTMLFAFAMALIVAVPALLLLSTAEPSILLAAYVVFNLVVTVGFFGYRIVFEGLYGYTPGKKLLDISVVTEAGGDIGWKEATVRNLVLIADNLPVAYLLGIGLILYDEDEQRLGDMAANTYVVRA
ncbi:RDD family protein [Haloarcula salinisoli]|uniref:RDD family protein n=1 Tax=Haloarcula salinisoli TaxID=2487746 RepID=A0A8J7YGF5_9EURY|nr:RDD family protein [Halomicroarcula salinisoli]MBX0285934.1 RDD family protein [Halomicroarcula salinisoli]MBX0302574.1 RDD family protein [Halomicroarcula salinisoli]